MIEIEKVSKSYGPVQALSAVSLQIAAGEIVGLLGPNGAGKTTLLQILNGLFEPTSGRVQIGGIDVIEDPVGVRRLIGYLPENAPLYPEMLVQESLLMTADLRGLRGAERDRLLRRCIRVTGLESVLTRPIGSLSKGFCQRVGLAQANLHEPKILILDEPTNGLDPEQIIEVRNLIRGLARQSTVILSTHILSEVELTCERVVVLINGRLRADARLSDLTTTNRFRVAFAAGPEPEMLRAGLTELAGAKTVRVDHSTDDLVTLSVEADSGVDLSGLLYERAKSQNWPLRELRRDTRSLESVFRALSSGKQVQL